MKRIAGTFMLLACLGGCMNTNPAPTGVTPFGQSTAVRKPLPYVGPYGEPIAAGNNPTVGMSPGLTPANYTYTSGNGPKAGDDLTQTVGFNTGCADCQKPPKPKAPPPPPPLPTVPRMYNAQGIVPVPAAAPPGAVAAIGALPAYAPRMLGNARTEVRFGDPPGMKVTWFGANGFNDIPLETPSRYNFLQGGVYRLKLSSVANRVEKVYYPTLEVLPCQPKSVTYLAHSAVPLTFTDDDFEQVDSGNFLVKVVYLPDPQYQDLATVVGPNELVSTRLEPGVDPIVEAQKRGTILLILRMGNIDLQAPNTPAMDAPSPFMGGPPAGMGVGPGGMIPGPNPNQAMPNIMPPPDKKGDKLLPVPKPIQPKVDESSKPSILPPLQ